MIWRAKNNKAENLHQPIFTSPAPCSLTTAPGDLGHEKRELPNSHPRRTLNSHLSHPTVAQPSRTWPPCGTIQASGGGVSSSGWGPQQAIPPLRTRLPYHPRTPSTAYRPAVSTLSRSHVPDDRKIEDTTLGPLPGRVSARGGIGEQRVQAMSQIG